MTNEEKAFKKCNECNKNKRLSDFWNKKSSPDGRCYKCIECSTTGINDRKCIWCNDKYSPNSNIQKYCCVKCRRKHKAKIASNNRNSNLNKLKTCNKCNIEKDISEYHKHKTNPDGHTYTCKNCSNDKRKKYYLNNKQDRLEYAKNYRKENLQTIKIREEEYRKQNIEKLRKQWRKSYYKNQEKIKDNLKNKYQNNPKYKLNRCMSSGIYSCLKENKAGRNWETLVPYTIKELKKHLESQFKKGMTWDNYGNWHIDHIIPKSKFNFSKPEHIDFQKCWSLENLQPLWANENISKKDKLIKSFQPSLKI